MAAVLIRSSRGERRRKDQHHVQTCILCNDRCGRAFRRQCAGERSCPHRRFIGCRREGELRPHDRTLAGRQATGTADRHPRSEHGWRLQRLLGHPESLLAAPVHRADQGSGDRDDGRRDHRVVQRGHEHRGGTPLSVTPFGKRDWLRGFRPARTDLRCAGPTHPHPTLPLKGREKKPGSCPRPAMIRT